ncbi:uncharacterized protein BDW70DRAFT_153493 [Aspergillus foveolatus]|uniref:uncharacterized protein n=1 Tax=Aspergillus foveolatus TaxID=210207 RepID=UPI003CCD4117
METMRCRFGGSSPSAVLERISLKGYLSYVFSLRLQDNYDLDEASRVVQAGYDALVKRIPVVGYEAAETLRRRSMWPLVGERLPMPLVQAKFIRRELLLTWCIVHMACDGRQLEDHPGYTLLSFTPQGAPLKMMSRRNRGQSWISTNNALLALAWRTLMAVQSPLETLEGDRVSTFNVAIDGQPPTSQEFHPNKLGCFLEYVSISVPIIKILGEQNIAHLALPDDVVALANKLEGVDLLVPTAFLDAPGFSYVQTSWIGFELNRLDWGALLSHQFEAVRSPHIGVIEEGQVVLPVLSDGE